jgi:serine/threonine protein kinase
MNKAKLNKRKIIINRMRRTIGGNMNYKQNNSILTPIDVTFKEQNFMDAPIDRVANGMRLLSLLRKRSKLVNDGCDIMSSKLHTAKDNAHTFIKIKRIGSDSSFGEAHLVKNIDDPKKPIYLAVKLLPLNDYTMTEIKLYKRFTPLVLKQQSPHFPIIIGTSKCNDCEFQNENLYLKNKITPGCYYVFNELANGDLKQWSATTHATGEYFSMMAQILLSLTTLHAAGFSHNDLHWGNMLYHTTVEGGYWHYCVSISKNSEVGKIFKISRNIKRDLYVKNTGQQWVLWDFGLMNTKFNKHINYDMSQISNIANWAQNNSQRPHYPPYPYVISSAFKSISQTASLLGNMRTSDIIPLIIKNSVFPESIVSVNKLPSEPILNIVPYTIKLN